MPAKILYIQLLFSFEVPFFQAELFIHQKNISDIKGNHEDVE